MEARKLLIAIPVLIALPACSNSVEPDADDDPIEATTYYDVQINLWRIEVLGDCDANTLIVANQGEFSYSVSYAVQDQDRNWSKSEVIDRIGAVRSVRDYMSREIVPGYEGHPAD